MKEFFTRKRYFPKNWRGAILASIAIPVGGILYYAYMYTGYPLEANHSLITALVVAPFAFFLWWFRTEDKHKDQDHVERELKIKEINNDWDNLIKYQELAHKFEEQSASSVSAIYALSEYYAKDKDSCFPDQVHVTLCSLLHHLKLLLSDSKKEKYYPTYNSVAFVIRKILVKNFKYISYCNLSSGIDFSNCVLTNVNFFTIDLENINLSSSDLRGANLSGVKRCQLATLKDAKYNSKTQFPKDFEPERHGMIKSE